MKKTFLLLLLVLCLALSSCGPLFSPTLSSNVAGLSPEALIEKLEIALAEDTGTKKYKYASDWLSYYGLDSFEYYKLLSVESIFDQYFIEDIPPSKDNARAVIGWLIDGLKQNALDHTDKTELTDFLISAYIVSVGDKYATYLNKENFEVYMSDLGGNFVGIGVAASFDATDNTIQITSVIAGSPAESAGILAGDYITHVDGEAVADLGYYAAVDRIRGEEGTVVKITVKRGDEALTFDVTRAPITEETVYPRIIEQNGSRVGYMQITTFSEVTFDQFKAAVDQLEAAGVNGIIFDMRNNGGGLLDAVLSMLDYLLPDGQPLARYSYYDGTTDQNKGEDGHQVDLPFAVLTNAYTASAAELFSSALQDYAKQGLIPSAKVIGTVSYGKGSMQRLITFTDDTAVTVTIAKYHPPFSPNYEGVGVIPDFEVNLPDALVGKNPQVIPYEEDAQLQFAVNHFAQQGQ